MQVIGEPNHTYRAHPGKTVSPVENDYDCALRETTDRSTLLLSF